MTAAARRLLEEARQLSSAERVELFERLGAELEAEAGDEPAPSDAWRREIQRRIARIDAEEVELVDADELERELWAEQLADEAAEARR